MGTEYWSGLVEWLKSTLAAGGFINPEDLDLFLITDDVDEAVAHIVELHKVMSDKRVRNER